jgi:phage anti-repressor protein
MEGQDYVLLALQGKQKSGRGGHNKIDYAIPLYTAEHLCMVSG